jgi:hypothetical protein
MLDSLNLGAIRLTTLFVPPEETGPIFPERYSLMKKSVRNKIVRTVQRVRAQCGDDGGQLGTAIDLVIAVRTRREADAHVGQAEAHRDVDQGSGGEAEGPGINRAGGHHRGAAILER